MPKPIDPVRIDYGAYVDSDADSLAKLFGDVFSRRDPPAYAVDITPAEFEAFVRLLCPGAAADGLTIVARRSDSGELVGAMLNEDCTAPMPEGMNSLSAKFDPIMDILGQMGEEYWREAPAQPGEALHMFLLGVAESAAGRGVAQQLVASSLELGAARGYRRAVTEATNKTSQHIFRKQGFVERVRRSYAEHVFDGKKVFTSIAEHGGPMLMDRALP